MSAGTDDATEPGRGDPVDTDQNDTREPGREDPVDTDQNDTREPGREDPVDTDQNDTREPGRADPVGGARDCAATVPLVIVRVGTACTGTARPAVLDVVLR